MSGQKPGGEATEEATPKRLQDARRRGEVFKSREVVSLLVVVGVGSILVWTWPHAISRVSEYLKLALRSSAESQSLSAMDVNAASYAALEWGGKTLFILLAPALMTAFAIALLANYLQVGSVLTLDPMKPKLERLNPVSNLKNLVGKQALVELLKSIVKLVGFIYVAADELWKLAPKVIGLVGRPPEVFLETLVASAISIGVKLILLAVVLAIFDFVYQRFAYNKKMKMTKEEVKRESKEMEGDPQRKSERQRIHREMLEEQMLFNVKSADCVVINPTEIAVAIRYDKENEDAPKVVARGRRLTAAKIRQLAKKHGIPIVRNVSLARSLVELELDDEIPADLYEAVAEVLRFVYKISGEEPDH